MVADVTDCVSCGGDSPSIWLPYGLQGCGGKQSVLENVLPAADDPGGEQWAHWDLAADEVVGSGVKTEPPIARYHCAVESEM